MVSLAVDRTFIVVRGIQGSQEWGQEMIVHHHDGSSASLLRVAQDRRERAAALENRNTKTPDLANDNFLESRTAAEGRSHSMTSDRLPEAKSHRPLYGNEFDESSVASRPTRDTRRATPGSSGISVKRPIKRRATSVP